MTATSLLPLEAWPAADREMWARLTRQASPFDDPGPLAHLAEATQGMSRSAYGKWLSWIAQTDPAALDLRPEARATLERFLSWLQANNHLTPSGQHTYAGNALRALFKAFPGQDWSGHWHAVKSLDHAQKRFGSRRKDGRILDSGMVLQRALQLAEAAESERHALPRALQQRNGCLLAFLTLIPLRRRALAGLRLGQSLLQTEGGFWVEVSPEMSKTATRWSAQVPDSLVPVLTRYLDDTRPWLLARSDMSTDRLWITKDGKPLTDTALSTLIRHQTRSLFGIELSPHLFRDMAATTLARHSPADARLIRPLLAHASHQTAERHYNHAKGIEVGRFLAEVIRERRGLR